jgi:tRNA threonylcarbamoyladenosine biosynthesis protein TsaE
MSDEHSYVCHTVDETQELGRKIGKACINGALISLRGSLGAGKTVIAKGVAQAIEISDPIVSPTFTLIQEYEGKIPLQHMDLYRIDGVEEFEGIGGEELLYLPGITLIEWSEKIEEILPDHTIYINLEIQDNQDRLITIKGLKL